MVRPICPNTSLNLVKYYISIEINRPYNFWLEKRGRGKSLLGFRVSEPLLPQAMELLDAAGLPYVQNRRDLKITVDQQMIQSRVEMLTKIIVLLQKSSEE